MHLNIFGTVLLQTMREVMGPERWDEDMEAAWADIYMHISEVSTPSLWLINYRMPRLLVDGRCEEVPWEVCMTGQRIVKGEGVGGWQCWQHWAR